MASFDGMNQSQARANKYGGPWSNQESQRLEYLVAKYTGPASQVHWVEIAREHGTRDAKQCRERWDNHLKPGLRRDKISDQEGAYIMEWVSRQGKHWAPLGRTMGRPENMVKNYWYQEHKKLERGGRQKGQRVSSPAMSRSNSSSSQNAYGAPSVSPTYPSAHSYHQGSSPTFTCPQYYQQAPAHHSWSFNHSPSLPSQQYSSRRVSDASALEQTPSLASDHGSPVESPRTAPGVPYPHGQFTLPSYMPPSQQPDLLSPKELLEKAQHRRSTSSSSYGSTGAIPVSPTSKEYRLQSAVTVYSHGDGYHYRQGDAYRVDSFDQSQRSAEPRTSTSTRKSSDSRMSISSLIS
ncbi:Myb-like DNA-binding protein myb-1 [Cytospora mali]|uniref:Myb-like DNA-binding protein myb-1 n=1 Tax=Cytospora mali TaxID=578113 RepID=A0A194V4E6_CYTMA|nr:Myb-like DNA-binding protein myb-1 [Valsa mali var. pyri (nom. inval.)]